MENKNTLVPFVIVSLAIVISAFLISRTGIYIKNTGGVESNGKVSNTISVSGDGRVSAKPDMVRINVGFQETAPTSQVALSRVNEKVSTAMTVLKNNGIPESDITTDNLSIYTEYDYSGSSRRVIGQRASQSLEVKIKKIDAKGEKAAKIIDQLSSIENVQMHGIYFDIEDKTQFFTQARELAFNKAQQKAEELAKLSKVKLTKPISISDSTYDIAPQPRMSNVAEFKALSSSIANDTQISTGELNISANLSILWGIE